MTTTIPKILRQPHKYTICPSCKSLNYYDNVHCNTEYYDCKTEIDNLEYYV